MTQMETTTMTPRLPEVGEFVRGHGTLYKVEQPTPPPPPPPVYIFSAIEARCELRRNGKVLRQLQTLNDFYGLETSVTAAVEEMKRYSAENDITPASEVEVVVIRVVSYFRARPGRDENFYDKKFRDFKALDHGTKWDVPDNEEAIVWSSRTGATS